MLNSQYSGTQYPAYLTNQPSGGFSQPRTVGFAQPGTGGFVQPGTEGFAQNGAGGFAPQAIGELSQPSAQLDLPPSYNDAVGYGFDQSKYGGGFDQSKYGGGFDSSKYTSDNNYDPISR